MTGISDQFRRNFEQSTVMTSADKDKAEEGAKGKGKGARAPVASVPSNPRASVAPIKPVWCPTAAIRPTPI